MIPDKPEEALYQAIPLTGITYQPEIQLIQPPYELDEIILTFGDIFDFIDLNGSVKPSWADGRMGFASIPFEIPLSYYAGVRVNKIYCHKKLISIFTQVFQGIYENNLHQFIQSFGGCYGYRNKYNQTQLSAHSWGIAIDLNPNTNAPGSRGDMNPDVIKIFQSYGFEWGGNWKRKYRNPMHFQWCTGY